MAEKINWGPLSKLVRGFLFLMVFCSFVSGAILSQALAATLPEGISYLFRGLTNGGVNVRAEANKNSTLLDSLKKGEEVYVLGVVDNGSGEWYEVIYGDNQRGYVHNSYVDRQIEVSVLDQRLDVEDLAGLDAGALLTYGTAENAPVSGEATVVFEGIGMYSGSFEAGKRAGTGVFLWDNGDVYEGEWASDRINGSGCLTLADGAVYEGTFSKGNLRKGTVRVQQANGALLERTVSDGKLARRAVLTFADGTRVEGNVSNQKIEGQVTIAYANGDVYAGNIKDGLKSGTGTYTWTDGAHYTGNWKNDQMEGKGTYYFSEYEKGYYISGQFAGNEPAGTMTYVSAQGVKYQTEWEGVRCVSIRYGK